MLRLNRHRFGDDGMIPLGTTPAVESCPHCEVAGLHPLASHPLCQGCDPPALRDSRTTPLARGAARPLSSALSALSGCCLSATRRRARFKAVRSPAWLEGAAIELTTRLEAATTGLSTRLLLCRRCLRDDCGTPASAPPLPHAPSAPSASTLTTCLPPHAQQSHPTFHL